MKIAINRSYGGFSLSEAVLKELGLNPKEDAYAFNAAQNRNNPCLIAAIAKLGCHASSGACAKIRIVEIPDDVDWTISEYDGMEIVEEVHRSWC